MTVRKGDLWNIGLSILAVVWLPIKDWVQALLDGQTDPNFSIETWILSGITSLLGALLLWYQSRKSTDNDKPVVGPTNGGV